MDWYLDSAKPAAGSVLRREFGEYLRRHADAASDVWGAELAFDEVVANAVEHAGGPVWVSVDWSAASPLLTVHDLGPGFQLDTSLPDDLLAESGRGMFLVSHLAEELRVASKAAGGTRVQVRLPVTRPVEDQHDPAPRDGALPSAEEAAADGTFGKESFLRALVVQLAQQLEFTHGPAAAEAAVAQVGADVGGAMEQAYRAAHGIAGRLSPEEMADLYVRLKHAIDGDFFVIEATPERIVLGNRACPFGDVVRKAPALCRMTSSVFGGVAARNAGGSTVHLEERIAVGDPECRVVVWLGDADPKQAQFAHQYRSPA